MLKLKLVDGQEETHDYANGPESQFEERKEGIRFFDTKLKMVRMVTWNLLESFEYAHMVTSY